jgi:hypothetical protein
MSRIFTITKDGQQVKVRKVWCYDSLSSAKAAARNYVKSINRRRRKDERVSFEEFRVEEFVLRRTEEHVL